MIDKPAGLVVHPAPGHAEGTLVHALIGHCGESLSGIGGVRRPGIVHRLDKDTSGLLVVAKTDAAHQGLADLFADHGRSGSLTREYLALVWGAFDVSAGKVDAAIGRHRRHREKMAVVPDERGRHAVTHWRVEEAFGPASLIACRLETGRTHQIRVHMASIGTSAARRFGLRRRLQDQGRPFVRGRETGARRARPAGAARGDARLRASDHRRAAAVRKPAASGFVASDQGLARRRGGVNPIHKADIIPWRFRFAVLGWPLFGHACPTKIYVRP